MNKTDALQFLEKDNKKRMGHGIISGWKKIASHPFFHSIDWRKMDNKQCRPMYVPSLCKDTSINEVDLSIKEAECFTQPIEANEGVMGWINRYKRSSRPPVSNRYSQNLKLLEQRFKTFDYTIFDQYEGFLDEHLMTVGPPPDWVKPAFPGADNGSILPICKIYLETQSVFDVFDQSNADAYYWSNANYNSFMVK
jgi:serine/threonine kinase 32